MSFLPKNWNVLLRGAWNPAILTPSWVGVNIFGISEGQPVQVEVPMDTAAPWRIRHENCVVIVNASSLEVACLSDDYATLDTARQLACKALEKLPITPVTAAGFNLRYVSESVPAELAKVLCAEFDGTLSNGDFTIIGRSTKRALKFESGVINCEITFDQVADQESTLILLNFHRSSSKVDELRAWLSLPISQVEERCEAIFSSLKGVTIEQATN